MERGFKYRIYPNACQREQIARTPWRSSSPSATSTAPTRISSDACARAGSRASPSSSRVGTAGSPIAPTAARSSTATISRCQSSGLSGLRYPDRSRGVSCRSRSPWTQPAATSPPFSAPTCRPRTRPRPTGKSESTSASRRLRRFRTAARSGIRAISRNMSASSRGSSAGFPAGRAPAGTRSRATGT